jgi:DNA-binding protein YbaB
MPREIDDAWIEEAIASYRAIEQRQAGLARALAHAEVTVRSTDGLIEVVTGADGVVRSVNVVGRLTGRSNAEVSRSIQEAIDAAHDAAAWAKRKVYDETFSGYEPLPASRPRGQR